MWSRFERYLRELAVNIRREKEMELNRRGFIASSLGFVGLLFVSSFPFAARALPRHGKALGAGAGTMKIAGADELKVGESKVFRYPDEGEPAILVRLSDKDYRSYFNKCTHLQCPVYWEASSRKLACPCHNGFFSVEDGSVLAGPPPRPLTAIKLRIGAADGVYADGVIEGGHT